MERGDFKAMNLEIMDEFDSFCRANGIRYSIGYGTLLGAVRHKGFIPWDDDMSQCLSFKWKLKLWFARTMHPHVMKLDPVSFVSFREELIRLCSLLESDRYAQICCTEYDQPQWFHKSSLESYAEYEFEGRSLMGWADYDSILKEMYGDYMTLPPVEKRKPLQNYIRFCWK